MLKQKLILQAVQLYQKEMKLLRDERKLLENREDLCFDRFLDRCKEIHELTFMERWKQAAESEMEA